MDGGDEDDATRPVKPVCDDMTKGELRVALESRGIKATGFLADDRALLQAEFDTEYAAELAEWESRKKEREEKRAREEAEARKRMEAQQERIEEQQELNKNERFRRWLQMVQDGRTATTVKLPVGPVSCRIVMRALSTNSRIVCLDLNGCLVGEKAGERIGDMIKVNTTIVKLDVETCALGPRAAKRIAQGLEHNTTLVNLVLEDNPLSENEQGKRDLTGIRAIAAMFAKNATLRSLNVRRTGVGLEAGQVLERGLQANHTLAYFDFGGNGVGVAQQRDIVRTLDRNREAYKEWRAGEDARLAAEKKARDEARAAEEARAKEEAEVKWMEERRAERWAERKRQKEEAERRAAEEREKKRLADEAAAKERARQEAESKKKKKKGKKKKKK